MSEREFTRLVGRSVDPSLARKLLFVFPLTNAHFDLTKRKMSSNGSANVKHSEIITRKISATSRAWRVRAFFFSSFQK